MRTQLSIATLIISALILSPAAMAKTKVKLPQPNLGAPERVACEGVFGKDVTLEQIIERFGKDNVVPHTQVVSIEGEPLYGTLVYPDDPQRKIAYQWFDEDNSRFVAHVALPPTLATPGGLYVGQTLAEVVELNGERISMSGFWWDYGGYPFLHEGGKLWDEDADCLPILRLAPTHEPESDDVDPSSIVGDTTVYSDNPLLEFYAIRVSEAGIGYEFPEGYHGFDEGEPPEE